VKHAMKAKICSIILGSMMSLSLMAPNPAVAGNDPLLGELMLVGFTFCPRGWTEANGQLLPIAQNTALFSLYGTTYGGDGRTTFALPDLRGRAPIHYGQGPGLQNYAQGQRGGAEDLTVGINNMPSHNHEVQATNSFADKPGPGDKLLAADDNGINKYYEGPPNRTMSTNMITNTGGGQPIAKRSPYLAMRWCVALVGVYPSRN